MKYETLGDWCKWLEKNFSPEIMIPTLPVIIRLDGNNFHNWTKGLKKPFDTDLNELMTLTTQFLVKETNAVIGYQQSDEITLILWSGDKKSSIYNDGKKQKILSKLTSKCSNFFNDKRSDILPNHNKIADFDCRIYQTPTLEDACLQLLWREKDATKNSISMLAQSLFSHNSLQNLNSDQLQYKMFTEKGVNWNELDSKLKRGVYIKRRILESKFTQDELEGLPDKHLAKSDPNLTFKRSVYSIEDYPPLSKISNRVDVIFNGDSPIIF
jgi:tRNA(His) guanylyltransferase